MSSNSSSIVISFSIAILLLLVLLLLVSYNSKCKMDNIERFENETMPDSSLLINPNLNPSSNQNHISNYPPNIKTSTDYFSVADNANKKADVSLASNGMPGSSIKASDPANDNYASVSNNNSEEGFSNRDDENTCFLRDRLTSTDLLPKDAANSKWAQINPSGSGDMRDQNFLTAGYHIGINTVGQSLRNANLQLRSEPPNPQIAVSPWGISTIEPDIRKVAFEIGSAPSF